MVNVLQRILTFSKRPRAIICFIDYDVHNQPVSTSRNVMYRFICRLNDSENLNVVAMVNIMYSDTRCTSQFWGHWYKRLLKISH